MNGDSERSSRAHVPARGCACGSADELLNDLSADAGTEAKALAAGYWIAIRDSESACLNASGLLKDLQAETGSVPEAMGLGDIPAIDDDAVADARAWRRNE